jgi:hypothetical protein
MELTILTRPWRGTFEVADENDATSLVLDGILLDGEEVLAGEAFLHLGVGSIHDGPPHFHGVYPARPGKLSEFATVRLTNADEEWFATLEPDDYALHSTPANCTIIVHSIKIERAPAAMYRTGPLGLVGPVAS